MPERNALQQILERLDDIESRLDNLEDAELTVKEDINTLRNHINLVDEEDSPACLPHDNLFD